MDQNTKNEVEKIVEDYIVRLIKDAEANAKKMNDEKAAHVIRMLAFPIAMGRINKTLSQLDDQS